MPFTANQLFSMGAQHSIESLISAGHATFADAMRVLSERFGPEVRRSPSAVSVVLRETTAAFLAGEQLSAAMDPLASAFGRDPNLPQQYRYTVIAGLPDPLDPSRQIRAPWTINSETPLTYQQILNIAEQEVASGVNQEDSGGGARGASAARRRIRLAQVVTDIYGGEAPITLEILAAYRRS